MFRSGFEYTMSFLDHHIESRAWLLMEWERELAAIIVILLDRFDGGQE